VGETVISNRTLTLCVCALLVTSTLCRSEQMSDLTGKKIPFKLYGKYLVVVEGSIGGLKKKNFLIDTGTNPTIVDEQIAKQLQLRSLTGMPDSLPVVTGVVRATFAVLPHLQFGPIRRDSMKVVIEDLSPLHEKVWHTS
jgi:predicted aspartyl protease